MKIALAARDYAAIYVMVHAGLRVEEAAALTVDDLCFARGAWEVRVAKGRGNKDRIAPMGPRLSRSLRRYLKARDALVPTDTGTPPFIFFPRRRAPASPRAPYGAGSTGGSGRRPRQ